MSDSNTQLVCAHCGAINRVPSSKLGKGPLCGKCKTALLSASPIAAGDHNFQRLISKNDLPVVVDFWADWCGPCQQFAPIYSQIAGEMKTRAIFVKLDTQTNQQTAGQWQIRSIPTLMIFHRGKEMARLSGALPKAQFEQWLGQHLPSTN